MNEQGITEETLKARMMQQGIDREAALREIRAEEAGDIPEFLIREKMGSGLTRVQAIESIKAQRENDQRVAGEAAVQPNKNDRTDLHTTDRFERLLAERNKPTAASEEAGKK